MNSVPEPTFTHRWWRWWQGLCGVALAWLLICAWLARPLPPWAADWAGWWTGERWGQAGAGNFTVPHLGTGVEIGQVDGDSAIRTAAHTSADLGRLPVRQERLTVAGWVKVTTESGAWPEGFLVCRTLEGDRLRLQLGFEAGRAAAKLQLRNPQGDWVHSIGPVSSNSAALGQWQHLAYSTDGMLNRLTLNGAPGAELRSDHEDFALARLEVGSWVFTGPDHRLAQGPGPAVAHDDVVLFDRVLPPEELQALATAGRGAWTEVVDRPERARRCWHWGWPIVLTVLLTALVVRWLPGSAARALVLGRALRRDEYRLVRWVVALGTVALGLLVGTLEIQGLRSDAARFQELGLRLGRESEGVWRDLDQLLQRAREWWLAHPGANHADWQAWLDSQHYPAVFPGVIGVGCAQQVLPAQLADHEAEWTRRDGFAHRVQPAPGVPRVPLTRLAGEPRLPVVLYVAHSLGIQPGRWLTNQSILGHDLLFQAPADARPWSQAHRIELALTENVARSSSVETIAPAGWYGRELTGLRLYLPVVSRPLTNGTDRLSPEAWRGVVFASVNLQALVEERLKASPAQLGFRITFGDRKGGRYDRVVDTGELDPAAADRPGKGIHYSAPVAFYDDVLWFDLWTTDLFDQLSTRRWARWIGIGGLGLLGLMAALLVGQIRARQQQAVLLTELRQANERLEQSQRERARLSRDLHDGTIQSLYAVGLHLQHAGRHLGTAPDKTATGLEDGQRLVQDTIVELREFLLTLHDERGPAQTFAQTIEALFVRLRRTTPVDFELAVAPEAGRLPARTVVQLVNVVREAVSNALRHGRPAEVTVTLRPAEAGLRLEITDNGAGFELADVNGGGYGLRTMRERAAELGGQLNVRSAPGTGTTVRLDFPAPPPTVATYVPS